MTKLAFHVSLVPDIHLVDGKPRTLPISMFIDNKFKGINFTWNITSENHCGDDSRWLIEFVIQDNDPDDTPYTGQEQTDLMNAIVERLARFGGHKKSDINSAKALAEKLSCKTVNIAGTSPEETLEVQWPTMP